MRTLQTPTEIANELVDEVDGRLRFGGWSVGSAVPEPVNPEPFTPPSLRQRIIGGAIRAIERDRAQARESAAAGCYAAYLNTFAGRTHESSEPDVRAAMALGVLDRNGGILGEVVGSPYIVDQPRPAAPRLRTRAEVASAVALLLGTDKPAEASGG